MMLFTAHPKILARLRPESRGMNWNSDRLSTPCRLLITIVRPLFYCHILIILLIFFHDQDKYKHDDQPVLSWFTDKEQRAVRLYVPI